MQINQAQLAVNSYTTTIKADFTATDTTGSQTSTDTTQDTLAQDIKDGKVSAKDISNSYIFKYNLEIQSIATTTSTVQGAGQSLDKVKELLSKLDVSKTGYSGKEIQDMTPDEAKALVADDGFFGVAQTSKRLSDFVLAGGGDDVEKLKAGREGMLKGFKDAEQIWGEKLPDIAYQTIQKATETIDKKIEELGGKALDATA